MCCQSQTVAVSQHVIVESCLAACGAQPIITGLRSANDMQKKSESTAGIAGSRGAESLLQECRTVPASGVVSVMAQLFRVAQEKPSHACHPQANISYWLPGISP